MLYRPNVCNCTMPYVPRTVPAYAVRDPAYTAEVFALTLVEIDVASTLPGPYWRAGLYETGQCTHWAERMMGRARSIRAGQASTQPWIADFTYCSHVSQYAKGTAGT